MKKNTININSYMQNKFGVKKWKTIKFCLISLPIVIHVFLFSYVPLLGWIYAFCDYKAGSMFYDVDWVGLKHFKELFKDRDLARVLKNTLVMSFAGILMSPIPVIFAIMINDLKNAGSKKFIQTVTTFPNFISWVIVGGLSMGIFSSSGLFNKLLQMLGFEGFLFGLMGEVDYTYTFMTLLGVWKGAGWGSILYLAAITGIDMELYDAAKVDGANKLQLVRHITIPGIMPTFVILRLLDVSNILNNGFEKYYIFWNSLVASKIEVLDYRIYQIGLGQQRYS